MTGSVSVSSSTSFDLVVDGADAESAAIVVANYWPPGWSSTRRSRGWPRTRATCSRPEPAGRAAATAWYEWAIDWTAAAGGRATGGHVGALSVRDWIDPRGGGSPWSRSGIASSLSPAPLAAPGSTTSWSRTSLPPGSPRRWPWSVTLGRRRPHPRPIRLCLDVGHMCVPGTSGADRDPYAWLRAFGPVAPVVQLQQSDAAGDHHWPFTPARNASGRIDGLGAQALGQSGATACD